MPSSSKKSYGPDVQARVRCLLQALLEGVAGDRELERLDLEWAWSEDGKKLTIETTLRSLVQLVQPELLANTSEFKKAKTQAGESLIDLRDFVSILDDHRIKKQGSDKWHFSLRLWGQDTARNLEEFDKLWESQRSPAAKQTPVPKTQTKPPLKPGAPFPKVRLPENFVPRPDALNAVKEKLLAEDDRTLVVSAIAGLGGLGKSVLATALVLDQEVQARFTDGILWVTLGQHPDLQTLLGEWIRELDKSREAFSANTPESASQYLDTLLAERRMLLVVDDVWNSAHAEWFRVGGAGCRVLVTTREAQIEGADYYPLDLMSGDEAITLVRQKLGRRWNSEQEAEAKAFAKVLGYLPLALDLAANQVRDGLSWAELRSEFEAERRAVARGTGRRSTALKLLDSSEKWDDLGENQQRKYSLQACFNLSLKRLNPEQLQQFTWLGVLPEDANLSQQTASVLWDLTLTASKRALVLLRKRSFLTESVGTIEGETAYRVHDLMHDMARGLISEGILAPKTQSSNDTAQNLPLAHRQFLQRYRERAIGHRWDKLPNDGYIHRHLTWHMEQADWAEEVHSLMAMNDEQGCNAWFEVCDKIGQPAIFVEDVARGWRLAEAGYAQNQERSIVLQCRYALITSTLNSLVTNLPVEVMAEFVKRSFWTVEQAWAYVEQMQDEPKIAAALQALMPYLPKSLFQHVVIKSRSIRDEPKRAKVLRALAQIDGTYFPEALEAACSIQSEYTRSYILRALAQIDGADFSRLLEATCSIQSENSRLYVLCALAQMDGADFSRLLEAADSIQDKFMRAEVLCTLAQIDDAYFFEALKAARSIQDEDKRAKVLCTLAQIDETYFPEALEVARSIQDEDKRAKVLCTFAQMDGTYFFEALETADLIQDEDRWIEILCILAKIDGIDSSGLLEAAYSIQFEYSRAEVLCTLAKIDGIDSSSLLEAAYSIQNKSSRAYVLCALTQIDETYFLEALEAARSIQDEFNRAYVLCALAQMDGTYFSEALEVTRLIGDESKRAYVLCALAKIGDADFPGLLEVTRSIGDEFNQAYVLCALARMDGTYFSEALETARLIQNQDEDGWAEILCALAQMDGTYFSEALEAARSIRDKDSWTKVLCALAKIDGADFAGLLEAACLTRPESRRAKVLCALAQIDDAYFFEALKAACSIQDESKRAKVLCALAQTDGADLPKVREAACLIQNLSSRAYVLCALAQIDVAYFSGALEAARLIQSEYIRAEVLCALAKIDRVDFPGLLEAACSIQDKGRQTYVLCTLTQTDGVDFSGLLEATDSIQDESRRAYILCALTQMDETYFSEALEAACSIQDESKRAKVLCTLAQIDGVDCSKFLEAACSIQDVSQRTKVLCTLAQMDETYFSEALEAARSIQDESKRAKVLCALAQIDGVDCSKFLEAVRSIQDESKRAEVLCALVEHTQAKFSLTIFRAITEITHKPTCARVLSAALPRLLSTLPQSEDWLSYLSILAHRLRSDLMQDLVTLRWTQVVGQN